MHYCKTVRNYRTQLTAVVLFLAPWFEISREPLNNIEFAPNSHGRCLLCSVPRSYNKFEDQCQRSRSPKTKTAFSALSATCVRFVFGKTSLAPSLTFCLGRSGLRKGQEHPAYAPVYEHDRLHLLPTLLPIALITRMWADAERDGRPAKYSWRPLRKFRNSIP